MESKHTQGKWVIGYGDDSGDDTLRVILDNPKNDHEKELGKSIAVVRWGCSCCKDTTTPLTEEEKANLKMMAAAPKMAQALERFFKWWAEHKQGEYKSAMVREMEEALKSATE